MRANCLLLSLLLLAGCATVPKTQIPHTERSFPAEGLVTQRGVLTALGKQYTLNGYVASSPTGGRRLIITENFGSVLADVLVKPDGTVHVMRSSKAFKPKWIEKFVAADLRCVFGEGTDCPGEMLSPTHYIIQRRWYKLDLQVVATKPGPQSPEMFDETKKATP